MKSGFKRGLEKTNGGLEILKSLGKAIPKIYHNLESKLKPIVQDIREGAESLGTTLIAIFN